MTKFTYFENSLKIKGSKTMSLNMKCYDNAFSTIFD